MEYMKSDKQYDNSYVNSILAEASSIRNIDAQKSLRLSREAIQISGTLKYSKGLAKANYTAGVCCRLTSDFENSKKYFEEALKTYRSIGDKKGESRVLNSIGNVYMSLGNYDSALEYLDESIYILQAIGDIRFEATVLSNKALAFQQAGNLISSLENNLQSLSIYKCANKPIPHTLLNNIGILYLEIGNYSIALKYFNEALNTETETGNLLDQSSTIANIGRTYLYMNNCSAAITYLSEALIKIHKYGNRQSEAQVYSNLGKAYSKLRCFPEAITYFNKSLNCYKDLNDSCSVSHSLAELGKVYTLLNDFNVSKKYFDESLELAVVNKDDVNEVRCYMGLAALYMKFINMESAEQCIIKAIRLSESRNSYKELSQLYKLLSEGYLAMGNTEDSIKNLQLHYDYLKKLIQIEEENSLRVFTASHNFKISEDNLLLKPGLEFLNKPGRHNNITDNSEQFAN